MKKAILIGGCVKIPDGRIGRVRKKAGSRYIVRVRRRTSASHQFLEIESQSLKPIACPKGWMSVEGYNSYLKITLEKLKKRQQKKR